MRLSRFLLIILLPFAGGCSTFIARWGKEVEAIPTQSEAREDLGKPVASGIDEGQTYDDFRYHGKVSREMDSRGHSMALGMSFGLAENILFPAELIALARGYILGEDVRYYYDETGNVTMCRLNGRFLYGHGLRQPEKDD